MPGSCTCLMFVCLFVWGLRPTNSLGHTGMMVLATPTYYKTECTCLYELDWLWLVMTNFVIHFRFELGSCRFLTKSWLEQWRKYVPVSIYVPGVNWLESVKTSFKIDSRDMTMMRCAKVLKVTPNPKQTACDCAEKDWSKINLMRLLVCQITFRTNRSTITKPKSAIRW